MMSVLRVASNVFDVDAFLTNHPTITADSIWHRGEPRPGRSAPETNGCNIFIAEEKGWDELLHRTMKELQTIDAALRDAQDRHGNLELDFAVEAGENDRFTVSARFSPDDMRILSDAKIKLCITVYPPSND
jgi:hypothetical protein